MWTMFKVNSLNAGSREKKKRALVYGAYGVGNIGDEAVLSGLLKTISYDETIVFSSKPAETSSLHKVFAEKTNLKRFLLCDDIIIGGGELFQNGMAWKFSLASIFAKLLSKRVKVVGVGVDITNPIEKLLTSLSLRFVDEITVRDKRSYQNLICMRLNASKIKLQTDLVFNLTANSLESPEVDLFLAKHDLLAVKFVILFLRAKDPETDRLLIRFFRTLITDLTTKISPLRIIVVPFSKHPDSPLDDDTLIIQKLNENLKSNVLIEFDKLLDPYSLMYLISKADLVISTRLHPLIFSKIINKKAIAIPLFPKIRSFAEKYCYQIIELENLWQVSDILESVISSKDNSF